MAVVWVTIGANISCCDATIWNDSDLKSPINNGTFGLPEQEPLPDNNVDMPYYIIADDAFALSKNLIKSIIARRTYFKLSPITCNMSCGKYF